MDLLRQHLEWVAVAAGGLTAGARSPCGDVAVTVALAAASTIGTYSRVSGASAGNTRVPGSVPALPQALVVNIGDMLDRLTGGVYRSTPHRVLNVSGRSRLSFPFFFDPGFDAQVVPLPGRTASDDSTQRWDKANLHAFTGAYGDYLLGKVGKVFPGLKATVLE